MDKIKIIREFAEKLRNLNVSQHEVWEESEQLLSKLYSVTLFTVLFFDHQDRLLVRLYSNREDINPIGGPWSLQVLRK